MKSIHRSSSKIQMAVFLSIIALGIASNPTIARPGVATMIFLRISPSAQANAMGQTYGNTIYNSPMAMIHNPASLGFFARDNQFGSEFYKHKVDWLPGFRIDGLWYDASSVALGINLKDYSDIPVSIGIGSHEVFIDLGETEGRDELNNPTGTFRTWERSRAATLSVAVDYYIRISYGYTWKNIESHLSDRGAGQEVGGGFAEIDAVDYGFIVEVPVLSLSENMSNLLKNYFPEFKFYYDPGFFYSKSNIGRKVSYYDAARTYPIPRTVSVGINLKAGVSYLAKSGEFKLPAVNWSREVDDLVIDKFDDGTTSYRSGLHDIKFWENVIWGALNDKIDALKEGFELNFGDMIFVRRGRYEDIEGSVIYTTKGLGVNYMQPVKLFLKLFYPQPSLWTTLLNNLSIEEHYSEIEIEAGHQLEGTKFRSFVIRFRIN